MMFWRGLSQESLGLALEHLAAKVQGGAQKSGTLKPGSLKPAVPRPEPQPGLSPPKD